MKGLELSRSFYEEYGAPMLRSQFPEIGRFIAAGLVGAGSECFGYDDDCSHDHDFEPGFCLFLPGEEMIDRRTAFLLERAYAKLPKEYKGFCRQDLPPAGGARHGVIRISDFYEEKVGAPDGALSVGQWLSLPASYLAEATNGEVFSDPYGEFSRIRAALLHMPEDIRMKKLAGHLWTAAQSAPYNYGRCLSHGEPAAAQWALHEFTDHAISVCFLICRVHRPFYKWCFRALRALPLPAELPGDLASLLFGTNDEKAVEKKTALTEKISSALCDMLFSSGFLPERPSDLSHAAFAVNDRIADNDLRNMNLLSGV